MHLALKKAVTVWLVEFSCATVALKKAVAVWLVDFSCASCLEEGCSCLVGGVLLCILP